MLSFLKKLMGNTQTPEDVREQLKEESIIPVTDIEQSHLSEQNTPEQEGVVTSLSLHETWEKKLSQKEKYALSFMAQELPRLSKGKISLAGTHIVPHDEGIEVTAFIRNSSDRPVHLETMTLVVLFGDQQLFTRQSFDLAEVGEIPAHAARPWTFLFTREHYLKVDVLLANWKVAFELAQKKMLLPQQLELEESWIKALSDQQKQMLIELAQQLPALKKGEVNVQSVQLRKQEDGTLHAILLIRNGSTQALSLEKLPLAIYDATEEIVAQGMFELNGLTVNPSTSKPWLFIFPSESVLKPNADLTWWKAGMPQ